MEKDKIYSSSGRGDKFAVLTFTRFRTIFHVEVNNINIKGPLLLAVVTSITFLLSCHCLPPLQCRHVQMDIHAYS